MSTLFVCSQCECIVSKMLEKYLAYNHNIAKNGVCWEEIVITLLICLAVIAVAYITKTAVLGWKAKNTEGQETDKDGASTDNDKTIKFIEKLIDSLQSQTKEYGEKGEFKKYKAFDSPECKMYNNVLVCLIAAQQQENKTISIDDLRNALGLNARTETKDISNRPQNENKE